MLNTLRFPRRALAFFALLAVSLPVQSAAADSAVDALGPGCRACVAATGSRPAFGRRELDLGIGVTQAVLFGDAGTRSRPGLGLEMSLVRRLDPLWSIRGAVGGADIGGHPGRLLPGMSPDLDFSTRLLWMEIAPRYDLRGFGRLDPFVTAGFSVAHRASQVDSLIYYPSHRRPSPDGWAMGLSAGLGLRRELSGAWISEVALGVRYHATDALDNIVGGSFNDITTELRVSLSRRLDAPSRRLVSLSTLRDSDADGIPDWYDSRIFEPEDLDGFQDEDGAPDLDNDSDGIPDSLDKAPNDPEDFDGFQDEDGAPDLDNDNDGIPDVRDGAPNDPETFNGYRDEDGIPDEVPAVPPASDTSARPSRPPVQASSWSIYFAPGRSEFGKSAARTLDKVAGVMRDNARMRLELRGYADATGNAAANLELSRKRAEKVRNYLIKKGASATNLRILAMGEGKRRDRAGKGKSARGAAAKVAAHPDRLRRRVVIVAAKDTGA